VSSARLHHLGQHLANFDISYGHWLLLFVGQNIVGTFVRWIRDVDNFIKEGFDQRTNYFFVWRHVVVIGCHWIQYFSDVHIIYDVLCETFDEIREERDGARRLVEVAKGQRAVVM